jgi:hypothetical protein
VERARRIDENAGDGVPFELGEQGAIEGFNIDFFQQAEPVTAFVDRIQAPLPVG